jgi:multidrug efflux pump subunit AcrB
MAIANPPNDIKLADIPSIPMAIKANITEKGIESATTSRACREVGQPILFSIAIIIIVFLPLFTLEGVEGKTFRTLAYTVSLAMLGSLIYALFLAPVLSDLLMRRKLVNADGKLGIDERILNALLTPYRPAVEPSKVNKGKNTMMIMAIENKIGCPTSRQALPTTCKRDSSGFDSRNKRSTFSTITIVPSTIIHRLLIQSAVR